MFDLSRLILFILAGLALNITPGPDMMYVIARSVGDGRKSGIASALGVGAGSCFHIAVVALGGAALFATQPGWFRALQVCGAGYLIYMGVQSLRRTGRGSAVAVLEPARLGIAFRQGLLTNVFNPKVILFFFAFLPQFVDPSRGSTTLQLVTLGVIFNVNGTAVNVLVAVLASGVSARLQGRFGERLRKAAGLVFIGLGVRLAFAKSSG